MRPRRLLPLPRGPAPGGRLPRRRPAHGPSPVRCAPPPALPQRPTCSTASTLREEPPPGSSLCARQHTVPPACLRAPRRQASGTRRRASRPSSVPPREQGSQRRSPRSPRPRVRRPWQACRLMSCLSGLASKLRAEMPRAPCDRLRTVAHPMHRRRGWARLLSCPSGRAAKSAAELPRPVCVQPQMVMAAALGSGGRVSRPAAPGEALGGLRPRLRGPRGARPGRPRRGPWPWALAWAGLGRLRWRLGRCRNWCLHRDRLRRWPRHRREGPAVVLAAA
mmetsp:Transcript_127394/g.407745  ORF Transcript_127394/g.407745 Transcript_127394/m.407745 type:complete len:278 (+) Transcript_127394:67-900(+)